MDREKLFREAIKENSQRIFRICSYYFPDPDDRNDAFQDALIRIWDNLSSFKGQSQVSTWIYRIAVNTCLGFMRREKRRKGMIDPLNPVDYVPIAADDIPEDHKRTDEKLQFFRDFIYRLSVSDRTLVSLYLEELSTKEMAEVTGLSESNVRVRIFRIKEQVKKEWEEKNYGT
jgi:RNA polymerase sigma-70 factor (ECF subfamily)